MNEVEYKYAPVCLFVYKRLDTLRETIASLQKNKLAAQTDVYVFSDAAANTRDEQEVAAVRAFITTVKGFKSLTAQFAKVNKGLAASVISGVTSIIKEAEQVIVLEDDLIVSANFLDYMNAALAHYQNNKLVFSVAGYTVPIKAMPGTDVYFTKRASCWGWATWKDRWDGVDWRVNDFEQFMADRTMQRRFNRMGSDMTGMLKKQMNGVINSWAIRWTYSQFKNNSYTVFPTVSKVSNEGFGGAATHTSGTNKSRFSTVLDHSDKSSFRFPDEPSMNEEILKQFTDTYSIKTRVLYKLKGLLN